jgi:hypothetical protein
MPVAGPARGEPLLMSKQPNVNGIARSMRFWHRILATPSTVAERPLRPRDEDTHDSPRRCAFGKG